MVLAAVDCNKRVWIFIGDWLAFGRIGRYCGGGLWILQMIDLIGWQGLLQCELETQYGLPTIMICCG